MKFICCFKSLDIVLKYFGKRIIRIEQKVDLIKLLSESISSINELSENLQAKIKEQADGNSGSLIMTWNTDQTNKQYKLDDFPISFTTWQGKSTLRPLINIQARRFFLSLCEIDEPKLSKKR
jgi:hypothetical protein